MSRFSKIAGEMVPHLTVEQKIAEAMRDTAVHSDGPTVAVVGIPDEKKGESLVALTTLPIEQTDLRQKLVAMGLPNLWIPKIIKRVEVIPHLASGKLDLRACQKLAQQAVLKDAPVISP